MMDGFKYIDRGKGSTALLLPGWASDHRIFDSLDVDYDYLIPQNIHRLDIPEGFGKYYGDKKIALIGWSLGGLLGAEIFLKFPHIIDKAVFVGVREIYPADEIEVMRVHLRKNKKRYLKFF